ncbi:hypothetical protein LCGC14_1330440 [marine sediment metagenome]|uniref:Uncharacterized protein n=1 Tax=marine sediment metagenome TaxID=412755 RepID=A0A0F9MXN8_9ZZZZ
MERHTEVFTIRHGRFVPGYCPDASMATEVVMDYMLLAIYGQQPESGKVRVTVEKVEG